MINRVVLVGRLTKDPELRKSNNNTSVTSFTVACDRNYKQDGQSVADFINCVAWRQSAEYLTKYAHKGDVVSVEGSIQTRSYEEKGTKHYVTEVLVERLGIISGKKKEESKEGPAEEKTEYNDYGLDISPDDLPFF